MSGYFGFVAICVTQPLWPRSVPLSCRVSVISTRSRTRDVADGNGFFRTIRVQSNIQRKGANGAPLVARPTLINDHEYIDGPLTCENMTMIVTFSLP